MTRFLSGLLLFGCLAPAPAGQTEAATPAAVGSPATQPAKVSSGVAMVSGPVHLLDGDYAPNTGDPFEVAAGCHVLQTRPDMLVVLQGAQVRGRITPADIVIPMKAGYHYLVERRIKHPQEPFSKVAIFAREIDASQNTTQMFWPVRDPEQIKACRPNATPPQEVSGTSADFDGSAPY
jgi:hypothetical protein